jgi:hypothetical protein
MECQRVTILENGKSGLRVDGGACRREKNLNLRANDDKLVSSLEKCLDDDDYFMLCLKYCLI